MGDQFSSSDLLWALKRKEPMKNVIWNYDENGDPSTSTAPIGFRVVVIGNDVRISHASTTLLPHVSRIIRNFHWTLLGRRRSQRQMPRLVMLMPTTMPPVLVVVAVVVVIMMTTDCCRLERSVCWDENVEDGVIKRIHCPRR